MTVLQLGLRISLLLCLFFCGAGCAAKGGGTPEAKATAIVYANGYLTSILNGQIERMYTLIIWSKYLDENDDTDQEKVVKEALDSQKIFTRQNHPLFNLTVNDIRMRGDEVRIVFQRMDGPIRPTIEVDLLWAVNGWGIVDDNIFGPDGVLAEAAKAVKK